MQIRHAIVAGAGLAGLCAARELTSAGVIVTLIDARARAGGRVWTVRDGLFDGQHAELGGEFIDADQKAIRNLVNELGLELVRVVTHGFTHRYRCDGGWCLGRTAPWDRLQQSLRPLLTKYKAARGDTESDAVREIATLSLRDWLRRQQADDSLHSIADALRGFFLADADDMSVLPLVEQLAKSGSPTQATMYRIVGGNDRLVQALIDATPAKVLLGHTLRKVSNAVRGVIASVDDEQGHAQQIQADAMVMTLPASTLRDVEITPALPEDQWKAIRTLAYGRATKVVLQTSGDLFDGRRARAFATDTAAGAFWDGSEGQEGSHSIVTFLAGGSASPWLRQRAEQGAQAVLGEVCWLRAPGPKGSGLRDARVWAATWEDDPWARGGYAFLDPGFDPALRPVLSRRAGWLVFAGEHTSQEWQGYMNGAVESGIRAARELLSQ